MASAEDILGPAKPWEADAAAFISEKVGGKVTLTSGHRTAAHNLAVGGVPHSGHLGYGAYDFVPPKGMTMAQAAGALARSGVPFDQIIQEGNHVHVKFAGDGQGRGQVIGKTARPSAEQLLGPDPKKLRKAEDILGPAPEKVQRDLVDAAHMHVSTGDISKRLGSKPAMEKAGGVLTKPFKEAWDIGGKKVAQSYESIGHGVGQMGEGFRQATQPAGDPMQTAGNLAEGAYTAGAGALEAFSGGMGAMWNATLGGAIDEGPGKAVAEATKNAPHSITPPATPPQVPRDAYGMPVAFHDAAGAGRVQERPTFSQKLAGVLSGVGDYDMRLPQEFVGDAAFMIGGTALGGGHSKVGSLASQAEKARAAHISEPAPGEPAAPAPEAPPAASQPPVEPVAPEGGPMPSVDKKAARKAKDRAERNVHLGIADPETVKRMQDANPSPFTHPPEQPVAETPAALPETEATVGGGDMSHEDAAAREKELEGKDLHGVAEDMVARTKGTPMAPVAEAVQASLKRLAAAGVDFSFSIVKKGDREAGSNYYPTQKARGTQQVGKTGDRITSRVKLAGTTFGLHGMSDATILHETVHAVTNAALHAGRTAKMAGTELAKTTQALDALTRHVIKTFNNRAAVGIDQLHIGPIINTDELLAYGFTHEPFQRWLETIPYGQTNMWSEFVDKVRALLGMEPNQSTALSELLRHGNDLMNADPSHVVEGMREPEIGKGTEKWFPKTAPHTGGPSLSMEPTDPAFAPKPGEEPAPKAEEPKSAGGGDPPDGGGYGGSTFGPGDIPEPGSEMHHGPVVGTEADPNERLDNSLYRLGGADTSDKLEVQEFLYGRKRTPWEMMRGVPPIRGLPKELSDPIIQGKLAREIEQQIVNPSHQIPDELKPAYEAFTKYRDEVRNTTNRLRSRNDPDLAPFLPETGHTPRRAVGHTPMFDPREIPEGGREPFMPGIPSKRSLSKDAGSLHSRDAGWMVDDGAGGQVFTKEKPAEGVPSRIATMDEVEANTDIRYYKNPLINTIDEALRLRRVERNIQVLDEIKKKLVDEGLAYHYEWLRPGKEYIEGKDGAEPTIKDANLPAGPREFNIPEKFVPIKHIPQLKGWAVHPEIAEVLKDYYPEKETDLALAMGKVNRLLIGSLFITPIPHILNVAAHAVTGRGWDWLDIPGMAHGDLAAIPKGYARGFTTSLKAMHEVWTKGPKYRQLLREGTGFMYGDTQVRNFLNVMLEKAGHEITADPASFKAFSDSVGLTDFGIHNAAAFTKLIYKASNNSMWLVNDMFLMQRVMELEEKGMGTREAIKDAEKDIPNYRVPSRVMGQRGISEFIKSRNFIVFGRYKYGQWKALSGMFKDFVDADLSEDERLDALGKILMTGLTMEAIFPAMDKALQTATGNSDARVRRPGPFAILDAIAEAVSRDKDIPTAASSMLSISPMIDDSVSALRNRDFYGKPIIQAATPLGFAVQAFEFASGPIYPLKVAEDFAKPGGGTRAVGRMFGLDIPPEGTKAMQRDYRQDDDDKALDREASDPLRANVQNAIDKVMGGDKSNTPPPPPSRADPSNNGDWSLGPIP